MELPKEISEALVTQAVELMAAPYTSLSPYRAFKEAEKRALQIIQDAYNAGYRQRDAEVILAKRTN